MKAIRPVPTQKICSSVSAHAPWPCSLTRRAPASEYGLLRVNQTRTRSYIDVHALYNEVRSAFRAISENFSSSRSLRAVPRRSLHTPRRTLAGASALENNARPSPVVVFARHRSKHYREPDSYQPYDDREQERADDDPQRRQRIEDTARAYFRNTFAPLDFPAEVAMRMLTHASYRGGQYGHNTRLSFIGA